MLMPFAISNFGPQSGLSTILITISIGGGNALAAISLYVRPTINVDNLLLGLVAFLFLSTVLLFFSNVYFIPIFFIFSITLLRIAHLNLSEFNRQVHMQTNSEVGLKKALFLANVIANIIGSLIPVFAALLITNYGNLSIVVFANIMAIILFVYVYFYSKLKKTFKSVSVSPKNVQNKIFERLYDFKEIYIISLVNSVIFNLIYSYIPVTITNYDNGFGVKNEMVLGGYFFVN